MDKKLERSDKGGSHEYPKSRTIWAFDSEFMMSGRAVLLSHTPYIADSAEKLI